MLPGQLNIPGAEPVTSRTIAERRANAPLRPTKPQAPCDVSMFGDAAAQLDLVDMARRP